MSLGGLALEHNQEIRELGASEILVHYLQRHLVRLIQFDGPVDAEIMEKAFHQIISKRPILRSRILEREGGKPYFVHDSETVASFIVKERKGDDHALEVFIDELNDMFDPAADVPMRAQLLVRSDGPGGELLLSCPHSACDGRSLFLFCTQLLKEYEALVRGDGHDPEVVQATFSAGAEDVLPTWATKEEGDRLIADVATREAGNPPYMAFATQRKTQSDPRATHGVLYDLPADQVAAIRANCRANDTTVHGVIGAAEALAIRDVLQPGPEEHIGICTTLDIRGQLREDVAAEDMGIYAATLMSRFNDLDSANLWDLARNVKEQVSASVARNDHYTFLFLGEQYVENSTAAAVDPMMTASIANLGALQLPTENATLKPRLIRGALNIHPNAWSFLSLNAVSIDGHLAMTAVHNEDVSAEQMSAFISAFDGHLRWYAANAS